ncbi:MAG: thiamine-phosphate kinase, partial [Planctomycetota bacterium]
DISDGLSSDLNRICAKSGAGALIDSAAIPISEDAGKTADPLSSALHDGEDFELLFTISAQDYEKLIDKCPITIPITKIGQITDTPKVQIIMPSGWTENLLPKGYDHL